MSEAKLDPTPARTFNTSSPIKACRLRAGDLVRLYKIINDRQIEYGQMFADQVLVQQPEESPDQFKERRSRVANAFVTTVTITGSNNEIVSGSSESFLTTDNMPDNILTVFYTTVWKTEHHSCSIFPGQLSLISARFQRTQQETPAIFKSSRHQSPGLQH
jgi:hypothetical protein